MKTLQNYPTHRGNFRLSTLIAELQTSTQPSVQQKQNYGYPLRVSGHACAATLSAPNHMRLPFAKVGVIVMMLCLLASTLNAQTGQPTNNAVTRCASPRFLVSKGEENAFSLRSTDVTVNVVGVIADVNVRQIYVNKGATPVEATYIFPASTRAAVSGLTMTIGPRIVKAVIKEKEKARAEYIAAIQQGRTATLLDQITPNIFQMQVGNIPAHDSVVVDMHYTEAIELREGEYEFVYPGIVGPRYVSGVQPSEYNAVLNGFDMPQQVPGTFSIKTNIMAGVPITNIISPSHKLSIQTLDAVSRKTLSASAKNSVTSIGIAEEITLNRDYVVRYRLTGRAIESGLLLYKGEKENFFMLMVQPPKNVEIPNIVPREFVFIVDVSGSMQGQPTIVARDLMNNLFKTLRPTDKFNIMMFSGGAQVLGQNSVEATPDNIKRAYNFLTSGYGGGGTELLPALKQALAMKAEPGYARSFIAVTDGYVTVEREAFDLVRNNLNNANFYAFGIGGNVNRWLLEGLARAGNAESFIVTNRNEAPEMAERFRHYIEAPVLTGVKVDWGNMDVYDVDPGSIPTATAKRPIVVYGKWKGNATGTLRLTGNAANGAYTFDVNIAAQPQLPEHAALQYLWARNRIKFIEDGMVSSWGYERAAQPNEQQLITSIGLQYNLLTRYTSFIAVDSTIPVKKPVVKKDTTGTLHISNCHPSDSKYHIDGQDITDEITEPLGQVPQTPSGTNSPTVGKKQSTSVGNSSTAKGKAAKPSPQKEARVIAKRDEVDAKEVGKVRSVSAEPLTTTRDSVVSIATTQAGVQASGGGLVVRGSRNSDNKYLVDGQDVTDVVTGTLGAAAPLAGTAYTPTTATNTTEDVQVITGNSGAQYGNVLSGVVNSTPKSTPGTTTPNTKNTTTTPPPTTKAVIPEGKQTTTATQPQTVTLQRRVAQESTQSAPTKVQSAVTITDVSSGDAEADPLMPSVAPPRIYVGPVVGYMMPLNYTNTLDMLNGTTQQVSGTGNGFIGGLSAEFLIGDPKNSKSSIIITTLYQSTPTTFTTNGIVAAFKTNSPDTTSVLAQFLAERIVSRLTLGIMYKLNLGNTPFVVMAGVNPSLILSNTSETKATLPSGAAWAANSTKPERILTTGKIANANTFNLSAQVGIGYEFILKKIFVVPSIWYNLGLTNATSGATDKLNSLDIVLSIRFAL